MSDDLDDDPWKLSRFVQAQQGTVDAALAELRAGRKRTHWMWFVFPQLATLGRSAMARYYGLSGLTVAQAYLRHELLAPRLLHCTNAALQAPATSVRDLMGSPDDLKLRSSMTLFALADPQEPLFQQVLRRWYGGEADASTLQALGLACMPQGPLASGGLRTTPADAEPPAPGNTRQS